MRLSGYERSCGGRVYGDGTRASGAQAPESEKLDPPL